MTNERDSILVERNSFRQQNFGEILNSDPKINSPPYNSDIDYNSQSASAATSPPCYDSAAVSSSNSNETTPYMSPWNNQSPPYSKSPWNIPSPANIPVNGLMGSLIREEGHIYSLAASGDLLYTGSDSKNIRVWKNLKEFSGFKSNSGFVKAIIIHGEKIFTGHQDGKIRIWKASTKAPNIHKRIGSLPTFRDFIKKAINPKNYVEIRKGRNVLRIKHYDAVSCLTLNEDEGLLYSGSWDKSLKVWRVSDLKCVESIPAHDDAINSVVAGFDGLVFTGSADGTVKIWKRETNGGENQHFLFDILLKQENAVTALAVNLTAAVVYCGASDGLVNFWEREKQLSHGGVLRGHKMAVLCLAAAGNLVFSGSADKTICVWRKDNGGVHTCLSVFTGHTGPVKCLAVEEDLDGGDEAEKDDQRWIVYSGSLDKSVKVWRVSERAPDLFSMKIMEQQQQEFGSNGIAAPSVGGGARARG